MVNNVLLKHDHDRSFRKLHRSQMLDEPKAEGNEVERKVKVPDNVDQTNQTIWYFLIGNFGDFSH